MVIYMQCIQFFNRVFYPSVIDTRSLFLSYLILLCDTSIVSHDQIFLNLTYLNMHKEKQFCGRIMTA